MRVNGRDIVGRYISYFGVWEPNLTAWLRQQLHPGDVFVDVGANVGYFTLLASQLVGPTGNVVAVEAVPETAQRLRENVARNHASNVRVVEAAAWHEHGTLTLHIGDATTGTATTDRRWADRWNLQRTVEVPAVPLADLLTAEELQRSRIVKIDVEGAELHALRGLMPRLPRHTQIVVEVAPALLDGGYQAVNNLLADHGLDGLVLENDYSPSAYWKPTTKPRFLAKPDLSADQFDLVFTPRAHRS